MDPKMQVQFQTESPLSLAIYLPLWLCGREFKYSLQPTTPLSALIEEHPDLFASLKNELSRETAPLRAETTTLQAQDTGSSAGELLSPCSHGASKGQKEMLRASQLSLLALLACSSSDEMARAEAAELLSQSNCLLLESSGQDISQVMVQLEMLKLKLLQTDRMAHFPVDLSVALRKHSEIIELSREFSETVGEELELPLFTNLSPQGLIEPLQHQKSFTQAMLLQAQSVQNSIAVARELVLSELDSAEIHLKDSRDSTALSALCELKERTSSLLSAPPSSLAEALAEWLKAFEGLSHVNSLIVEQYLDALAVVADCPFASPTEYKQLEKEYNELLLQCNTPQNKGNQDLEYIELIEALTQENNELLAFILCDPSAKSKLKILSPARSPNLAQKFHENTLELDQLKQELEKNLHERPNPNHLATENNNLKRKLTELEAKYVLLQQPLVTDKFQIFRNKLREQNRQLKQLMDQKFSMVDAIGRLRYRNHRLANQVHAQDSLKEKLRSLNSCYNDREKLLGEIREQLEQKTCRTQKALRQAKVEKTQLLRTVGELTTQLKAKGNYSVEPTLLQSVENMLQAESTQLAQSLEKAKTKLKLKSGETEQLKTQISSLHVDYEKTVERLRVAEEEAHELNELNEDYLLKLKDYEELVQGDESLIKETEEQLNEALNKHQEYAITINGISHELATSQKLSEQLELDNSKLHEEIDYRDRTILYLEEDHMELEKLKTENSQLQESFNKLLNDSQEADTFNSVIHHIECASPDAMLSQQIQHEREEERNLLLGKYTELEEKHLKVQKEHELMETSLQKQQKDNATEIAKLSQNCEELEQKTKNLTSELKIAETESHNYREELNKVTNLQEQLNLRYEKLSDEHNSLETTHAHSLTAAEQQQQLIEGLRENLKQLEESHRKLKKTNDTGKTDSIKGKSKNNPTGEADAHKNNKAKTKQAEIHIETEESDAPKKKSRKKHSEHPDITEESDVPKKKLRKKYSEAPIITEESDVPKKKSRKKPSEVPIITEESDVPKRRTKKKPAEPLLDTEASDIPKKEPRKKASESKKTSRNKDEEPATKPRKSTKKHTEETLEEPTKSPKKKASRPKDSEKPIADNSHKPIRNSPRSAPESKLSQTNSHAT